MKEGTFEGLLYHSGPCGYRLSWKQQVRSLMSPPMAKCPASSINKLNTIQQLWDELESKLMHNFHHVWTDGIFLQLTGLSLEEKFWKFQPNPNITSLTKVEFVRTVLLGSNVTAQVFMILWTLTLPQPLLVGLRKTHKSSVTVTVHSEERQRQRVSGEKRAGWSLRTSLVLIPLALLRHD